MGFFQNGLSANLTAFLGEFSAFADCYYLPGWILCAASELEIQKGGSGDVSIQSGQVFIAASHGSHHSPDGTWRSPRLLALFPLRGAGEMESFPPDRG